MHRAPGESTGMFAMDEMALAAGLDPVEFCLRNDARRDEQRNLPYSSKALSECYRIGWSRRGARPGTLREGHWLVGLGCASATRPAKRSPCAARVRITADGRALVSPSTADLGAGTYTVMAQVSTRPDAGCATCRSRWTSWSDPAHARWPPRRSGHRSDASPEEAPRQGDLDTAKIHGKRVAEMAARLKP